MSVLKYQFVFSLILAALSGCGGIAMTKEITLPRPSAVAIVVKTPAQATSPTVARLPLPSSPPIIPTKTPFPTPAPLTPSAIASCPVTFPNGNNAPPELSAGPASPHRHGNGVLWTNFGIGGKIMPAPEQFKDNGSLSWKMGWDRGVRGNLTVTGRRLDVPAAPAQGHYDSQGYGDIGFQAGWVEFLSEGCWEITGRVGDAQLTFVTLIVRQPFEPWYGNWRPEGLGFKDLALSDFPNSIGIVYGFYSQSGLQFTWGKGELVIKTTKGAPQTGSSSPASVQQKVTVSGQAGICVQGTFDAQQKWQSEADVTTLEWSDGKLSYRITQTGLALTCNDLVRVATPP